MARRDDQTGAANRHPRPNDHPRRAIRLQGRESDERHDGDQVTEEVKPVEPNPRIESTVDSGEVGGL